MAEHKGKKQEKSKKSCPGAAGKINMISGLCMFLQFKR
jgi:hypothetical protein